MAVDNIRFTIRIPEIEQFEQRYAQAPIVTAKAIKLALEKAAIQTQMVAMSNAPVRSGTLRKSIRYKVHDKSAEVYTDLNYASAVEMGSGIYGVNKKYITPRTASVMATKINPGWGKKNAKGYYIIGKRVKGQKANDFMKRAGKSSIPAVKQAFIEAEQLIVKNLK